MQSDPDYIAQRQQKLTQFYSTKFGPTQPSQHESQQNEQPEGIEEGDQIDYQNEPYAPDQTSPSQPQELYPIDTQQASQLLLLTVQIDENRNGIINVFERDDPIVLAQNFCAQYGVSTRIVPLLAQNVGANMEQALRERHNMTNYLNKKNLNKGSSTTSQFLTNSQLQSGIIDKSDGIQSNNHTLFKGQQVEDEYNRDMTFSPKINKKSKNLAKNRSFDQGIKGTVYDRLFQDAQNKKTRQQLIDQSKEDQQQEDISRQKKSRVQETSQINYGQVLYQRGLKQREEKQQKVESVKRQKQSQIMQECSHQPQINEISKVIARRPIEPIGHHLNKIAKVMHERKENARSMKVHLEKDSCSFHPQLNKMQSYPNYDNRSEYIVEEKKKKNNTNDSQVPHYHNLYMDHKVRQQKIQQLDQQLFQEAYPFHPKVDEISEKIVQGTNFNDRLQKYQIDKMQSQEKSIMREQESLLQESQLFKPKTGRAPENRQGDPFVSLYNNSIIQAQNKAQKLQDIQEHQSLQMQQHANPQSLKMNNSTILSALQEIFDLLDNDNDGIIDAQRVDVTKLEKLALEVLGPLLLEMEEGNHSLSKNEFIQATLRLLTTTTVQEKHDLIHRYKKKFLNGPIDFPFHPMINDRSQRLAANKRPYGTPQVYEMFIEEKKVPVFYQTFKEFDKKIQIMKIVKDEEELTVQLGKSQINPQQRNNSRSGQKYP